LLNIVKPTVATFQETNVAGDNKIKVKNYCCFQRNRKGVKTMGGVATLVANDVKAHALKVTEGENDDEFLITRLGHVVPPVNILNVYGGIEGRMSRLEVTENWVRIKKQITMIKEREEGLVLIGDLNRAIGNDVRGVEGNHSTVSYGGSLVRELLEEQEKEQEYYLLNADEMAEGGPWTWVSRADSSIKSCIDLVVISSNLMPYVTKMLVDSKQKFCAKKVGLARGKERVIRSDHFPIIVMLEKMPKAKVKGAKESSWNEAKPGGWDTYKAAMEEAAGGLETLVEDENLSEEELVKRFDAVANKVKFKAFGKTKPMTQKAESRRLEVRLKAAQGLDDEECVKELMRKQYDTMEEEINKLKDGKFGRVTNVFKMKEIVAGSKKTPQESHAVIDEQTKDLVVENAEIKRVTLNHCMNTFKHDHPHEDVELLVSMVNEVHDKRMTEKDDEDMVITKDEFDDLIKKLEKKNKRSYDFLLKAGETFKTVVFKLCRRLIEAETFPARFFETVLHQLWKKKFPKEDLSNHRFLHIKDWLPKCCEALVVTKMKPEILKAGTMYQIGGLPNHRVEEHLIVVKAIIGRSMETDDGAIVELIDIEKFFDSENLRGVMNTLHMADVPKKAYRTWHHLNSKTVISVKTPAGITESQEAGEICAQGSGGAALASQLDIDKGVQCYFESSTDEAKYGSVRIQPQSYQDDVLRVVLEVSSARAGNVKFTSLFRERLLRCHPIKTCYVIYGTEKYKRKVREELERSPLKFGDFTMNEKEQDIYLGDVLSGKGLAASVEATIAHRMGKVKGVMFEVAAIMADHRMQAMGGMQVAWDIWERSIVPSLLANCGSWVAISKSSLKTLNKLQELYCRLIYSCPDSTPIPALRGEAGLLDMEHRIMIEKVCLVTRIMHMREEEEDSYAKLVLKEQLAMGWEGLTKEVEEICQRAGLPNAGLEFVDRGEVLEVMMYSHLKILKEDYSMEKLKHLKNTDLRKMQDYMSMASLEDARVEFKFRVGMLDNRANMGKKYGGKTCPHCPAGRQDGIVETSHHWLHCEAYAEFRQGADPELTLTDRVLYLRRVQLLRAELERKLR
jgi:exonuclease III